MSCIARSNNENSLEFLLFKYGDASYKRIFFNIYGTNDDVNQITFLKFNVFATMVNSTIGRNGSAV